MQGSRYLYSVKTESVLLYETMRLDIDLGGARRGYRGRSGAAERPDRSSMERAN